MSLVFGPFFCFLRKLSKIPVKIFVSIYDHKETKSSWYLIDR